MSTEPKPERATTWQTAPLDSVVRFFADAFDKERNPKMLRYWIDPVKKEVVFQMEADETNVSVPQSVDTLATS